MQRQNEITEVTELLNKDGTLANPGWCRHNLYAYNRENITAPKWRIKEWDFYQISNRDAMVQITFFNISIGSAATATYVDFKTGEVVDDMILSIGTQNRYLLPRNGEKAYRFEHKKCGKELLFDVTETARHLVFKSKKISLDFNLTRREGDESITIATPFKVTNRFFMTQKLNCMPAKGVVSIGSDRVIKMDSDDLYAVLDWGRGPWLHKNYWFWGNGTTMVDGKMFAFEITWGIGNEENATETAIFYDGKCHKIGVVSIKEQPDGRWMKPWEFTEENGRFELTMTPFYDHSGGAMVGPVGMTSHQVHGLWNGYVILDDGTKLVIKDMYAFCEKVYNKW